MIPPNFTRGLHFPSQEHLLQHNKQVYKCLIICICVFVTGKFCPYYLCHTAYWVIKQLQYQF